MYVKPTSVRFLTGKSTPARRAIIRFLFNLLLSLPLLVLGIHANHAHHTVAVHQLALVAHFLDGCSNLHCFSNSSTILPRVLSHAESSTRTRSPGRSLIKFFTAAPAACAITRSSFCSFTLTPALGRSSTTSALTAWSVPTGPPR